MVMSDLHCHLKSDRFAPCVTDLIDLLNEVILPCTQPLKSHRPFFQSCDQS